MPKPTKKIDQDRLNKQPVRLLVYDASCQGHGLRPGLSHSWYAGSVLYRLLGHFQHTCAAHSWDEALHWLAQVAPQHPIDEIQFWGHGHWGQALINGDPLGIHALQPDHRWHAPLQRIRSRLSGPHALWWFRTCETFGADRGLAFARAWTRFFHCQAAGHTHIIGLWQSGLQRLHPGDEPQWSATQGLLRGSGRRPQKARGSSPLEPSTVSCLHKRIPAGL